MGALACDLCGPSPGPQLSIPANDFRPVTFKGNVEYSTPFGLQKAYYYYDYPNSFERFDQDVWGTKTVIINDYTTNVTYTASNAQGPWKCDVGELTNGLWQSTIPANSTYKGNQVSSEHN